MSAENGFFAPQNLENRRSIKIIINNFVIIDKAQRFSCSRVVRSILRFGIVGEPIYLSIVYAFCLLQQDDIHDIVL